MQNIISHIKIRVPRTQIPHTDCKILKKLFFVKLLLSAFNIQALSAFTRSGPVPYDHYYTYIPVPGSGSGSGFGFGFRFRVTSRFQFRSRLKFLTHSLTATPMLDRSKAPTIHADTLKPLTSEILKTCPQGVAESGAHCINGDANHTWSKFSQFFLLLFFSVRYFSFWC